METKKVSELAVHVTEALIALGISPFSAWFEHQKVYEPIITLHR